MFSCASAASLQGDWRTLRLLSEESAKDLRSGFLLIAEQPSLADELTRVLCTLPWEACFMEAPPWRAHEQPAWELMLLPAPALAGRAEDPRPFARQLTAATRQGRAAALFPNLGGDALLASPCPQGAGVHHAHLLSFLRSAPRESSRALWRALGEGIVQRAQQETWISSSGLGVSWLHLRLDDRPKYYQGPYRHR